MSLTRLYRLHEGAGTDLHDELDVVLDAAAAGQNYEKLLSRFIASAKHVSAAGDVEPWPHIDFDSNDDDRSRSPQHAWLDQHRQSGRRPIEYSLFDFDLDGNYEGKEYDRDKLITFMRQEAHEKLGAVMVDFAARHAETETGFYGSPSAARKKAMSTGREYEAIATLVDKVAQLAQQPSAPSKL